MEDSEKAAELQGFVNQTIKTPRQLAIMTLLDYATNGAAAKHQAQFGGEDIDEEQGKKFANFLIGTIGFSLQTLGVDPTEIDEALEVIDQIQEFGHKLIHPNCEDNDLSSNDEADNLADEAFAWLSSQES